MNSQDYRKYRELIKKHGKVKALELYNESLKQTPAYKQWKKNMDKKNGGQDVSQMDKQATRKK